MFHGQWKDSFVKVTCRICDNPLQRLPWTIPGNYGDMAAYLCHSCQHLQTAMNVPASVVESQYNDSYSDTYVSEVGQDALDARSTKHVELFLKKNRGSYRAMSVCDVGTGEGWFLRALAARQPAYDLYGVDICRTSLKNAEAILGVGRIKESLVEFETQFDAITFFDVLEHLPDPHTLVRQACEKLRPGGICVCINPGWNLWDTIAMAPYIGEYFLRKRLSMAHVSVFSRRSITTLLEKCGLTVIETKRFTDIGRSFRIGDGIRGVIGNLIVKTLGHIGVMPRNRLLAIAVKANHDMNGEKN